VFRIIRTWEDIRYAEPFRVFGTRLCGRCQEVKCLLAEAGIDFDFVEVQPGEHMYRGMPRHHAATLLAVFTSQDELLPAVIGHDWESWLPQDAVERMCDADR
jgi:hypothetical protein